MVCIFKKYKLIKNFIINVLVFAYLVFGNIYHVQAQELIISPVPDWVIKRNVQFNLSEDDNDDGSIKYFLDDQQTLFDEIGPNLYGNQIVQLKTLQAIESVGTPQIIYNPAYQSYSIHHINIIRDGKNINVLPDARVTVDSYNAEVNTPDHEGANIVQIHIADIRRDDIIDFAFTLVGQNTAFGNRVIGANISASSITLNNVYRRLLISKSREIFFKYNGSHKSAEITENDQYKAFEWHWDKIDPVIPEDNIPVWHHYLPIVSYSEFKDWSEVVEWAADLFLVKGSDTQSIQEMTESLTKNIQSKEKKLTKIYSFMQSEIRYTGLEIGRNGYRPFKPDEVLSRRYGDCKDQTVLLVALLNAADIEAWPALVNSISGKSIENFGHSPISFNHAIVKAKIGNNIYWLDPTIGLGKGRDSELTPPRYEKALVLVNGTDSLEDIPLREKDANLPQISVIDNYSLPNGLFGEMYWQRETRYSGVTADFVRNTVDYIGIRQMGIKLREVHQSGYEDIENNEFSTAKDEGRFYIIKEDYKVKKAGTYDQNRDRTEFGYAPLNIAEVLSRPKSISDRKNPFALTFPLRRQSTVNITAPGAYFRPFNKRISNPYFTYEFFGKYINKSTFNIFYRFETHKEYVPVKDIKRYYDDIDLISKEMFFYLFSPGEAKTTNISVYQPIHNKQDKMLDKRNFDVHQKIDAFLNTGGLNYIEDSRDEVLEILNDKTLEVGLSDELLAIIISYCISEDKTDEAYFYHDFHVKSDGKISLNLISSLVDHLLAVNEYDKAIDVLKKEIADSTAPKNSRGTEIIQSTLRKIYWYQRDFENLASTLEYLIKYFPDVKGYYHELAVIYGLLYRDYEAEKLKDKMLKLGYNIGPETKSTTVSENGDSTKRVPRPLVRFAPFYPKAAAEDGVEGYVLTEITVKDNGDVENCRVIESKPILVFEKAACHAVENFFYYPVEDGEVKGDIQNVRNRIEFKLEN